MTVTDHVLVNTEKGIPGNLPNYTNCDGIRVIHVGGEMLLNIEDTQRFLCLEALKLPKEIRPNVKAAEDARSIIDTLLLGIGGDMEKFKANTKAHLEEIRQTRFAMVREAAEMTAPLKEVRQFFISGDYKAEIERLREFVDLCERLQKLKANGFLDSVADTMLRLAVTT